MRGDGKGDLPFKTNPHPMPCIPPSLPKFEERNSQGWRERGAGGFWCPASGAVQEKSKNQENKSGRRSLF